MTREEAIAYFKRHIDLYCVTGICREAEEMAIKALEQESCEDCISRQAVLNKFKEVCFSKDLAQFRIDYGSRGQRNFLINYIEQLPSITPQPKTGHWIYIGNSEISGLKICKCSDCEKKTYGSHNFCPNCGAKMVEPQERSDEECTKKI